MAEIRYQSGELLRLPNVLRVGDAVELTGDFPELFGETLFTSGEAPFTAVLKPPLRYLGRGREKLVLSCTVEGLPSDIVGAEQAVRAALGISHVGEASFSCQIPGKMRGGMTAFRKAQDMTFPTYPWYFESVDGAYSLTPDLSLDATVFTTTTRNLDPASKIAIHRYSRDIEKQLFAIATHATFKADPPVRVASDTYFLIIRPHGIKVILGDFDSESFAVQADRNTAYDANYKNVENFISFLEAQS